MQSLTSLTTHWIDASCAKRSAVHRIEGSYSGIAIRQIIETMIEGWKISKERVHLLVVLTDNVRNIKKALRGREL